MCNPGKHHTVGMRLQGLRKEKGWTLETMAKKIGSHKGYVSGIENHKVNSPSAKIMLRFTKAFGLSEKETKLLLKLGDAEKAPPVIRAEMVDLVLHHNGHCGKIDNETRHVAVEPKKELQPV